MPGKLGPGSTILVVGDWPAVKGGIANAFEESGYVPIPAPNGEAALKIVEKHAGFIDAVLTKISLTGLTNGWQVGKRFQEKNATGSVVYSSDGMFEEPAAKRMTGFVNSVAPPNVIIATLISVSE